MDPVPGVSFLTVSQEKPKDEIIGTLSMKFTLYATGLYLRCDDCTSEECPFDKDPFAVTPFSEPYVICDGHHFIDLSYFSEFTILTDPPRICFHDPTQNPGISVVFPSEASYSSFFSAFSKRLTIQSQNLPGFYKIVRVRPPLISQKEKESTKISQNSPFQSPPEEKIYFQTHSFFIEHIFRSQRLTAPSQKAMEEALSNPKTLPTFLRSYIVPQKYKAAVWSSLIGIDSIKEMNPYLIQSYRAVKEQWLEVGLSQFARSSPLRTNIATLSEAIRSSRQLLFTVAPHTSILSVAFNVIMTICQVFNCLHSFHDLLIRIFRALLSIYVEGFDKSGDKTLFIVGSDVKVDSERIESVLFWSMIYVIEKAEIIRTVSTTKPSPFETVIDLATLTFPSVLSMLYSRGEPVLSRAVEMLSYCFTKDLPLCDCTDLLIAAASSVSMFDYFCAVCFAALMLEFPKEYQNSASEAFNVGEIIAKCFNRGDHKPILSGAFTLLESEKELLSDHPS